MPKDEYYLRKHLVKILQYAYKNVPYYGQFNQLSGVNEENVYDIIHTLPILDKDVIRKASNDMYDRNINPDDYGKCILVGYQDSQWSLFKAVQRRNLIKQHYMNS